MEFEWDDGKARLNEAKHGINFTDAMGVFSDPELVILNVSREPDGEERAKAIGRIEERLFIVVFTRRGSATRIISARRANRTEERVYGDREGRS